MALELLPACDGPLLEFLSAADDFKRVALAADPDRQGQPPETLLGNHPVAHVLEPVQLPLQPEFGNPADVVAHLHDLITPRHADEPLINESKEQLGLATPAMR